MKTITSFDVFDTVLTRLCGSPSAVFLLLGRRLANRSLIPCTPEVFAHARDEAAHRAYLNVGSAEVTLAHIYAELTTSLRLDETVCQQLMDMECELEAELIRVVPGARERIEKARSLGHRVVFLSDMYLSREFIKEQLIRHGLCVEEECYVSSAKGKSKRKGSLYRELLKEEVVSPKQVTHHGNDLEVDIRAAKRVGLQTQPLLECNPNRYEEILISHGWVTEGMSSAMAGASRLARLSVPTRSPKEQAIRTVSAGVVAPTLVGYVLWVMQRAQELGLKRLYFLSRDGQILLHIASALAQRLNYSCELCYLYSSRYSWNLPAIVEISEEKMSWIWDQTDLLSPRRLLARVGIEPEEIRAYLYSKGFPEDSWDRAFNQKERLSIHLLFQDETLKNIILSRASRERNVLIRYFEQQGLFDPLDWGIVDIGWRGNLQNALSTLIGDRRDYKNRRSIGFYFGLRKDHVLDGCPIQTEVYFSNGRSNLGYINVVPNVVSLLEMFCSADHGTVINFIEAKEGVVPVLKERGNQKLVEWGYPILKNTVSSFIENLILDTELVNIRADIRPAIVDLLKMFWLYPTGIEVKGWSDFPWEDGLGLETHSNHLASSYTFKHIIWAIYSGNIVYHHRASWHAGSFALTPWVVRLGLKVAVSFGRVWRRFCSFPNIFYNS